MHLEVLNSNQNKLLPYLISFKRSFYLVGGTATALHIGYRQSIDFDLFTISSLKKSRIIQKLNNIPFKKIKLFEERETKY